VELDVHTPSQQGPWPVVVVVHGYSQNRFGFEPLARAIASQGAVVFNIDVAFGVPFLPSIERLACAVRFARARAPDYDGDSNRITLVGNSAGAASGMVVGLAGDDFEGDCIVSDGSALPDALVAYEGPYEFATTNYGDVVDHTYLQQKDPELLEAIDPYSHIGRNPDLQVRLIHGDDWGAFWYDTPLDESVELHQALADAGYDGELIVVDLASHGALTSPHSKAFTLTVQQVMELARASSQ
jgi:acetyl esterase/lipase